MFIRERRDQNILGSYRMEVVKDREAGCAAVHGVAKSPARAGEQ